MSSCGFISNVKLMVFNQPTLLTGSVYTLLRDDPIHDANNSGGLYGRFGMPTALTNFNNLPIIDQQTALMSPVPASQATHHVTNIHRSTLYGNDFLFGDVEFFDQQAFDLFQRGLLVMGTRNACVMNGRDREVKEFIAFELVGQEPHIDTILADAWHQKHFGSTHNTNPYTWAIP